MRGNAGFFLVALLAAVGCESGSDPRDAERSDAALANSSATTALVATVGAQQSTAELWSRSCALCHVDGTAAAPRIGNTEDWQPRLAKGRDTLLRHTLEGFGQMPPLGYCMACERDDFLALIDFMTAGIAPESVRSPAKEPNS